MKSTYILLPITLFMISCSSTQKKQEPVGHFVTHITEDGTKKFSYSLVASNPRNNKKGHNKGGGANNRGGGRGGKGGGQDRNRGGSRDRSDQSNQKFMIKEKFLKKLERTLFEKDYCHEGYSELDSFYDREMSQIKGTCEEKASHEDTIKFPNQ